ncbi:hypothetical protein GFS24_06465 [Chitinophaga sp. SYP-B3965]|uniref:hypothetical protein n=1 Tax=Chitinophaga sp. SYP-B3965 TaxID=2663120 RepID=UPI001299C69E|nr:hypothetical protein [Chitinophaga sp. SYP-B3965]MRG44748.1 hypothetical protein [Chitinophaga sp. SYP-B3965]
MRSLKTILIPVLIIATGITAWAITPSIRKMFLAGTKTPAVQAAVPADSYNEEADSLFSELAGIYNRIGQLTTYMAEGSIRLTDQADTSRSMFTRFRYCHKDSLTYYQLGEQETIAIPGIYITVNHSIHKIFLSPRENKASGPQFFVSPEQLNELKKERYAISKENMEPLTVIRLRNERHISCREYRVSYDSTRFIRRIFMRNSDETAPGDLSMDKLITITINAWQTENLPVQVFNVNRYVQQKGDNWLPAAAFRDYEVKYIY